MSHSHKYHAQHHSTPSHGFLSASSIGTPPSLDLMAEHILNLHWSALWRKPVSPDDQSLSSTLCQALKDDLRAVSGIRAQLDNKVTVDSKDAQARVARTVLDYLSNLGSVIAPAPRSIWERIFREAQLFRRNREACPRDTELATQVLRICEQLQASLYPNNGSFIATLPNASGMDHLQSAIVLAWQPLDGCKWTTVQGAAFELSRSTEHIGPWTVLTDDLWMGIKLFEQVSASCHSKASEYLSKITLSLAERVMRSINQRSTRCGHQYDMNGLPISDKIVLRFRATEEESKTAKEVFDRVCSQGADTDLTIEEVLTTIRVCISATADLPRGMETIPIEDNLRRLGGVLQSHAGPLARLSGWDPRRVTKWP